MSLNIQEQYVDPVTGRLTIDGYKLLEAIQNAAEGAAMGSLISQAEREILSAYDDTVSVERKAKSLLKFGRRLNLGTSSATVWESPDNNETYVTTNVIDTISSSNAGDAEEIYIEGHTVSGTGTASQFTFVSEVVTLNGQNKVTLSTPLARVSRAYVTSSNPLAGNVYVYQDTAISGGVPTDTSKIHITISGASGDTQTYKAATTFSNSDYFIVTGGYASIDKKTAASADFTLEVRQPGGVFRPAGGRISLNSGGQSTVQITFDPYRIVPKNSDIRITAIGSTTNVEVDASFMGYIALVTG